MTIKAHIIGCMKWISPDSSSSRRARSPARPGPNKNSTLTLEDDFLIAAFSSQRLLFEGRGVSEGRR